MDVTKTNEEEINRITYNKSLNGVNVAQNRGKNQSSFIIILRKKLPIINPSLNNDCKKQTLQNNEMNQLKHDIDWINNEQRLDFQFPNAWQLWLLNANNEYSPDDWNVKRFGPLTNTAKQFWSVYMQLYEIFDKENLKNLMIFRDPIEPKWEDKCNIGGGRWFFDVSFNVEQSNRDFLIKSNCWTQCMQMVMSRCLDPLDDFIVGMMLYFKSSKYRVSLWIRTCTNFNQIIEMGTKLQKCLNLRCHIKFELHNGTTNAFNGLTIDSSGMEIKKENTSDESHK